MSIDQSHREETIVRPPAHPVPQLQKPFEESMMESINDQTDQDVPADAMTRRSMLLEAPSYQRVIAGRWKQKPGEKYHPLWKLVAQMSFGMHLLAEGMAISEEEVMRILQSHVDDIDGFLERTTEDFDLAQSDIHERIRCLKLPLAHGDVFDRMLEDRGFRASILDGNEKIDHVISRTKKASKDALKDVQKGFDATNVLEKYLSKLNSTWKRDSPEHEAVLVAMMGNAEGWRRAFLELHLQGNKLSGSLKKLAEVVSEMQRRAATISRNLVARAQKTKHITTQNAGRAQSQLAQVSEQKPLPTEPGRHNSTRNSSRSTQLSGFSSRPNSGPKSSQGLTSQSPSAGNRSPRSTASRKLVKAENAGQHHSFETKVMDEPRAQGATEQMHSMGGLRIQSDDDHPIELPADVPADLLRQAPVSTKNRLSLTLGLKAKDNASHRISSIYYPKALGDLLKTPAMSFLLSPQPGKSKGTPVQAALSPRIVSEEETVHYFSHEHDPTIGGMTPESKNGLDSTRASPMIVRSSARASIVEPSVSTTRHSSLRSPAFTSHPAVMAMAAPPSELPGTVEREEEPSSSSSRKESQPSSLGEPGPELTEGRITRSASVSDTTLLVDTSMITVSIDPPSAEETFAPAQQKPIQAGQSQRAQAIEITEQTEQPNEGTVTAHPESQDVLVESNTGQPEISQAHVEKTNDKGRTEVEETQDEPPFQSVDSETAATPFVAELEAIIPKPLIPTPQTKNLGLVELEAPHQTFKLPPRAIVTSKNPEKEVPRSSISQLDDFFKLPTELTIKPGMKPKDFGDTPQPIRPLKLKLERKDGKIVPVQVNSPGSSRQGGNLGSKLRIDVVADIIETMSHTPPGSPLHARSESAASSNSAQRWSHRSSRSLGPPGQAPPPPGPGGRPMVNPDFAVAGQFDGERKKKKKGSKGSGGGSKSGWKSLFVGSTNSHAAQSSRASNASPSEGSSEEARQSADMMTTTGKDVLWFKGETKKSLGVSSA